MDILGCTREEFNDSDIAGMMENKDTALGGYLIIEPQDIMDNLRIAYADGIGSVGFVEE